MAYPALPPNTGSAADLLASLFRPSHPVLATAYESAEEWAKALRQLVREEAENVYQQRVEKERRDKLVPAEQGAELLGVPARYLLVVARRGDLAGRREAGTRRYYFRVGDLLDWQAANMREDGSLKRRRRNSAPGAKKKGD